MPRKHTTSITPASTERLLKSLRAGASREKACDFALIAKRTFYRMMAKGREQRDAGRRGKAREFLESVESAETTAYHGALKTVMKAMQSGNVTAAFWYLERKFPHEFSLRPERFVAEQRAANAAEAPPSDEAFEEKPLDERIDDIKRDLLG